MYKIISFTLKPFIISMFTLLNLVAMETIESLNVAKSYEKSTEQHNQLIKEKSERYAELVCREKQLAELALMGKEDKAMKLFLSKGKLIKNKAKVDKIREDTSTELTTEQFVIRCASAELTSDPLSQIFGGGVRTKAKSKQNISNIILDVRSEGTLNQQSDLAFVPVTRPSSSRTMSDINMKQCLYVTFTIFSSLYNIITAAEFNYMLPFFYLSNSRSLFQSRTAPIAPYTDVL